MRKKIILILGLNLGGCKAHDATSGIKDIGLLSPIENRSAILFWDENMKKVRGWVCKLPVVDHLNRETCAVDGEAFESTWDALALSLRSDYPTMNYPASESGFNLVNQYLVRTDLSERTRSALELVRSNIEIILGFRAKLVAGNDESYLENSTAYRALVEASSLNMPMIDEGTPNTPKPPGSPTKEIVSLLGSGFSVQSSTVLTSIPVNPTAPRGTIGTRYSNPAAPGVVCVNYGVFSKPPTSFDLRNPAVDIQDYGSGLIIFSIRYGILACNRSRVGRYLTPTFVQMSSIFTPRG